MSEIVSFLPEMTAGGYGVWTGVVAFLAYWGKQYLEERKLTAADRQARREGFEAQVTLLMNENRALRLEMNADRIAHAEYRRLCHMETDQLRAQVILLENEVVGYKRKVDAAAVYAARALAKSEERAVAREDAREVEDDQA